MMNSESSHEWLAAWIMTLSLISHPVPAQALGSALDYSKSYMPAFLGASDELDLEECKALAADKTPAIRADAAFHLAHQGHTDVGFQLLRQLLADPVPQVRAAAVRSLGINVALETTMNGVDAFDVQAVESPPLTPRGRQIVDLLCGALGDKDLSVQITAIEAVSPFWNDLAAQAALKPLLHSSQAEIRKTALRMLSRFSAQDHELLAYYVKNFRDPNPAIRRAAVSVFRWTQPLPETLQQALRSLLQDKNPAYQESGFEGLASLREIPPEFFPALVNGMQNTPAIQVLAIQAAAKVVDRPDELTLLLVKKLESSDPAIRQATRDALLRSHWPVTAALPLLRRQAQSPKEEVRLEAETVLVQWHDSDPAVAQNLARGLQSEQEPIRAAYLDLLANTRMCYPAVITSLAKFQKGSPPRLRSEAAQILGYCSQDALGATQALIPLLQDTDPLVRVNAQASLGQLGGGARSAIPALLSTLKSHNADKKYNTMAALLLIDRESPKIVEAYRPLLHDPDPKVRQAAIRYLHQCVGSGIGVTQADLLVGAQDSDPVVRQTAISAYQGSDFHPGPREIRVLLSALHDNDPEIQGGAASALAHSTPEARHLALPDILKLADSPSSSHRVNALNVLMYWREPAGEPVARRLLQDPSQEVQKKALEVLSLLQPGDRVVSDSSIRLLQSSNVSDRNQAALNLRMVHPLPDDAAVQLIKSLDDSNTDLRTNIMVTLRAYRKPSAAAKAALAELIGHTNSPGFADFGWVAFDLNVVPRERIETLLKAAHSENVDVHRTALLLLSRIKPTDPRAVQLIEAGLQDPIIAVKGSAQIADAALKGRIPTPANSFQSGQ